MSDKPESDREYVAGAQDERAKLRRGEIADLHERIRTIQRDLNAANAKLSETDENLKTSQEAVRHWLAKLEYYRKWNESVSVCENHTANIIDGPCVICELERYHAAFDWLERKLFGHRWSGTIGEPCTWEIVGSYRHELKNLRGLPLLEAILDAVALEALKDK